MAYCSACGSQLTAAARFCANCGVEAGVSTAIVTAQAVPLSQEQILYENTTGQLVSTTRAVLSNVTYPIASISSVRMATIAGSCWGPALLVLGIITLAVGLSGGVGRWSGSRRHNAANRDRNSCCSEGACNRISYNWRRDDGTQKHRSRVDIDNS